MALFLSKLFLGPARGVSPPVGPVPFANPVLLGPPATGRPLDTYTLMMASLPNGNGPTKPYTAGGGRISRAQGADFKHVTHTFALHGNRNPLTHRFLEIIQANLPSNNGGIVEVGSGDGGLAQMIRESFGVRVVETDLFASARGSPSRLRADMTALPLKTGGAPMVISSFAAEYPGRPAWQEIHRILKPGGMLVALVHHKQGIAQRTFLDRFTQDCFIWAARRPWIKALLPDFILSPWEIAARTSDATSKVGFLSQQEVVDLLRGIGFHSPHIQNAPLERHRSVSWIVVAKKR